MYQKDLFTVILAGLAAFLLVGQSFSSIALALAGAAVAHMYTKNLQIALGAAIVVALVQSIGGMSRPYSGMGIDKQALTAAAAVRRAEGAAEGFEASGPEEVHRRVVAAKQMAQKVETVTGVLESPSILDNVPLHPMQELMSDATPGASIPASAKARVIINPPAEGFVPAPKESQERALKRQPYLQNGEDEEGVEAALISKGTDMTEPEVPSNELPSTMAGEAPAF
jgi:hypothetical protein